MQKETHLKIAKAVNIVMSFIIFCIFIATIYFFNEPIKSFINNTRSKFFTFGTSAVSSEKVLKIIRANIIPSIVQVRCALQAGDKEETVGSGIYYLSGTGSLPYVQTNAHVVMGDDGEFHYCNLYFPRPDDGTFYSSGYFSDGAYVYHDLVSSVEGTRIDGLDLAQLKVTGPGTDENGEKYAFPPDVKDVFSELRKLCPKDKQISIGEKIYIIGYPNTGGESVTLTEGVVSGFTSGEQSLIKISASTNHGNSGGIVIGQDDGCYFGIVQAATFEEGSNLGYVLSSGYIDVFLDNLTGEKTYSPPASTTISAKMLDSKLTFGDVIVNYPNSFNISTTSSEKFSLPVTILNPPTEGALDSFAEGVVLKATIVNGKKQNKEEIIRQQMAGMLSQLEDLGITESSKWKTDLGGGHLVYKILYYDALGKFFGAPSYILDALFLYKDKVYIVTSVAGSGVLVDNYLSLFEQVVDSLELK